MWWHLTVISTSDLGRQGTSSWKLAWATKEDPELKKEKKEEERTNDYLFLIQEYSCAHFRIQSDERGVLIKSNTYQNYKFKLDFYITLKMV